jgi:hypothetical protein
MRPSRDTPAHRAIAGRSLAELRVRVVVGRPLAALLIAIALTVEAKRPAARHRFG